ncbi:MAG: hypothetical protein K0R61_4871 [Microvirga sp.]|nr:hypothetical protein [Microvirga sp.]
MESIKRAMIGASVALAASEVWAYRPRPPKLYAYPAYGPLVYGPDCHVARRTYYDAWGNAVVRHVQICD